MKKIVNNALIALTIIPLLGSCGKSSSGGGEQRQEEGTVDEGSTDGSTIDGEYKGMFVTLNSHVNGTIPGSVTLLREGDKLMTYARLFAGKPKAWHPQGMYMGTRCPNMGDDKNGDGFVDINEAMAVVGQMIIPFDANMNSQAAGKNFYPLADPSGYYHYERVSSFERMFDDLYAEDRDLNDHIAKLAPDEKFGFAGRVFMVQGVDDATILPETVGTIGKRKAFQTLPVVCAVIKRIPDGQTIGIPYDGSIPGPVAEVQEGQDRPAPYEDTTSGAQGGSVGGTTGTNDSDDGEVGDAGGEGSGSTAGSTTGSSTTGGSTTGGTTTGGSTTGGTTGSSEEGGTTGRSSGGFIGGFIGGRDGGTSGGSTGDTGSTTGNGDGGTTGRSSGGFIGGFIGGRNNGN